DVEGIGRPGFQIGEPTVEPRQRFRIVPEPLPNALLDDIDDSIAESPTATLSQRTALLKIAKVTIQRVDQFVQSVALGRDAAQHRRRPSLRRVFLRRTTRG